MKDEKIVRENIFLLVIHLLGPYVVNNYFRCRECHFELRNLRQTWKLEGQVIFPNCRGRKYSLEKCLSDFQTIWLHVAKLLQPAPNYTISVPAGGLPRRSPTGAPDGVALGWGIAAPGLGAAAHSNSGWRMRLPKVTRYPPISSKFNPERKSMQFFGAPLLPSH